LSCKFRIDRFRIYKNHKKESFFRFIYIVFRYENI